VGHVEIVARTEQVDNDFSEEATEASAAQIKRGDVLVDEEDRAREEHLNSKMEEQLGDVSWTKDDEDAYNWIMEEYERENYYDEDEEEKEDLDI
jgi:hypothetical protein